MEKKSALILAGVGIGLIAVLLAIFGNPANMALCIACFLRDTAGALRLHSAAPVQYLRPEILGIILGAFVTALIRKEFKATAGSSPATRFVLGFVMMTGALVFLGCSFRMVLRMAAGDLNAWLGLIGLIAGAAVGTFFLKKGFTLGKAQETKIQSGFVVPIIAVILLGLTAVGSFYAASVAGPGAAHAPILISLGAGLAIGAIGQLTRLCTTGAIRNVILAKDFNLLLVIGSFFLVVLAANLISTYIVPIQGLAFNLGMEAQPISHSETLYNILGLFIFGFGGVLAGGCPFRQLILTGQGSGDGAMTLLGLITGAALAHNFAFASVADNPAMDIVGGPTTRGVLMVVISIIVLFVIALTHREKQ